MKISLVVPVYNEEAAVPLFYEAVRGYEFFKDKEVEIVFISDGSTDKTEEIVLSIAEKDSLVLPLFFMRNFGKEPALMAGLNYATGDAVIPIDVDLQDPIEVIEELVKKWTEGADVVLAKRVDRSTDSFLKRKTAAWFYKVQNFLSDLHI
ncbi:MAG: glycosyltransferase family 2 protein, partial [Selenomonadaceae bacterium]|nr:glycosyltransferase family 2 protein [Selenomonadaceae bacterium]